MQLILNRTFLARLGGISDEFGGAVVRLLARRSRAKRQIAKAFEPDVPPKRTVFTALKFDHNSGHIRPVT